MYRFSCSSLLNFTYLLASGDVYVESVNGFLYVVNSSPLDTTSALGARFRPNAPLFTYNTTRTKTQH